jgi:bifunctional non-homologous end joining protein LigD
MDSLREYRRKRPPGRSPEPRTGRRSPGGNVFVIQRHDATRLHYDLRLEMNGVLKSWAVPKGPSLDPGVKRLAIQTEDHPLDYGTFEGKIPEGNYGAGEVILWDHGTYSVEGSLSAPEQLDRGEIKFVLDGQKLQGGFVLVRLKHSSGQKEWLLIKHRDANVQTDWNIEEHNRSVKSGEPPGPPRHAARQGKNSVQPRNLSTGVQSIKKAVKAPFSESLSPALASTSDQPFSRKDWIFEIKWDGMRALAFVRNGDTRLLSRSARNATAEFPEFQNLASHLRAQQAVLDGEIVVLDQKGRSDFQRLQSRFGIANPSQKLQQEAPATFYFFDILYCDGFDVRHAPLRERKELLSRVIVPSETVRISDYVEEKGIELFEAATQNGLEGVIAKQVYSPYPTGRSSHWLKFKSVQELDAVVGGWTEPRGSRKYFGSLLVGQYKNDQLHYIGGVGTGFSSTLEQNLFRKLQDLATKQSPFMQAPQTRERAHWVRPELVARVGYTEWTSDHHLRHPRFLGLQPDRSPQESKFGKDEIAIPPASAPSEEKSAVTLKSPPQKKPQPSQNLKQVLAAIQNKQNREVHLHLDGRDLKLTHLDKIYFPKAGYSKRDVLSYYATVSPFLVPFLKDRPLVLHRFPNGIAKPAFYQKEAGASIPEWIRTVEIFSETKGHNVAYFLIDDLPSLLYMTNLGCIEHNPFSARADDLDQPDYMFFDLDPSEGCPFSSVVRAAKAIITVLQRARLKFFIKTSGATGLHLFIPIERNYDFAQVRALLEIIARLADALEPGLLTRIFKVHDRPKNSVFVDVRQNANAQSLASVFSLRPREGAPVSTPLSSQELKPTLRPERWNIESVLEDLKTRSKLWANFWRTKQTLEAALSALENSKS